jgi:hypothetical protein
MPNAAISDFEISLLRSLILGHSGEKYFGGVSKWISQCPGYQELLGSSPVYGHVQAFQHSFQ